jgi:7-dehydrocholesterol reductase
MWSQEKNAESVGALPFRDTLGPLLLIAWTNTMVILFWFTQAHLDGSFAQLWEYLSSQGVIQTFSTAIYGDGAEGYDGMWPTNTASTTLVCFSLFELALMKLPGEAFNGPVTPQGNTPHYVDNAFKAYVITLATFICGAEMGAWEGSILIKNWGPILFTCNAAALVFCLFLTFKGLYFPSTSDSGTNGNLVVDFYWGTELYPRLAGWDVKVFTNCRFGLILWALLPISVMYGQIEKNDGVASNEIMVSCFLQLVYLSKFYWWERGYMSTIDIMQDRAGYYLCWGCLVWVPTLYTSQVQYIYFRPKSELVLANSTALIYAVCGALAIFVNYDADNQRAMFRTYGGECTVFGLPAKKIVAKYNPGDGSERTSLLLVSGYWGTSRHFHYLPEVLGSIFWSIPAGFNHFMPHFYYVFLTILLVDRAFRDEARCANKYGKYYDEYKRQVPYKIIPGVL